MPNSTRVSRRRFGAGSAAIATAMASGVVPGSAFAQAVTVDDWKQIAALSDEARKLGIDVPVVTVPESGSPKFSDIVLAIVDFLDKVDDVPSGPTWTAADVAALQKRASALLNAINAREKSPRQKSDRPGDTLFSLLGFASAANAETVDASKRYEKYRDGYLQLFDTCVVRPERKGTVDWYVDKLASPKYREAYEKLEDVVCVPWYFIGVIHALETSFNFSAHLHNGDPLDRKTTHVPAGRPPVWNPPSDWQSSAKDALTFEKYTDHTDWNLAKVLFRLEGYNGFRSRELHGINTPYLWSFSNHYTSGKFVADNEWSPSAVSQQCGSAVMIKELLNRKLITLVS
jgi:lysozyme family protein